MPPLGESMGFRIESTGTQTIVSAAVQTFRLKLSGMLELIAPEIGVAYEAGGARSLRRFTGVSNIRDNDGDRLTARIDFPTSPAPADTARWKTASETPLKPCAVGG